MNSPAFLADIQSRETARRHDHRQRALPQSPTPISFADNDYLALSRHPAVIQAGQQALDKYGTSARAARLLAGPCPEHQKLESALASWKGTERALLFASGYLTPLGAIPALVGSGDTILMERNAHACLFDGAKLSDARLRLFSRHDLTTLKKSLDAALALNPKGKILVVVESLHSMDGDLAPLAQIIRLKTEAGAWLLLDEAHAGGIFGEQGAGLASELGVTPFVDLQMGTLGKSLGSSGGFIASRDTIIDHLLNEARTFLFGTALSPSAAVSAEAALSIVRSAEGDQLRQKLKQNIGHFVSAYPSPQFGPIHPIHCGSNFAAAAASQHLQQIGLNVPAIRTPTVPTGTARLRLSLSARHTQDEVAKVIHALKNLPLS